MYVEGSFISSENVTLLTATNFSMKLFCSRPAIKLVKYLLQVLSIVFMQGGCRVRLCGFPNFVTFLVLVGNDCVFFEILVVWVC